MHDLTLLRFETMRNYTVHVSSHRRGVLDLGLQHRFNKTYSPYSLQICSRFNEILTQCDVVSIWLKLITEFIWS